MTAARNPSVIIMPYQYISMPKTMNAFFLSSNSSPSPGESHCMESSKILHARLCSNMPDYRHCEAFRLKMIMQDLIDIFKRYFIINI